LKALTWNQQVVKKNNKMLVLQQIMDNEPFSRADVAQVTGLNKATVSSLVNELLEEELIYEAGSGESNGGRRPVILYFNKVAGFSIGVDIGVNYILSVLTNLKGEIVIEKRETIIEYSYTVVLEQVKNLIRSLLKEMPGSRYNVVGISIGVPGIVDKDGTVLLAPNLGWKYVCLKNDIEAEFNVPVCVDNEANAGAYGEKKFGAGQQAQNLLYISAGIGIGVGIILNGKLYKGQSGFSGEMGHMIIDIDGRQCSCGSRGCWETYASERALLSVANQKNATLETLMESAEENDPQSVMLFQQIGLYLGYGINNIINAFNPEMVIVGNRLSLAKKWLEPSIRETIQSFTLPFNQNNLELKFSELSVYSAALGLSAFSIENFIKNRESVS
jgi:glucokinase-like ROK family protein